MFEGDYLISIICRNGKVNIIKSGKVGKATIDIESKPVCTASIGYNLYIGCMDHAIHCYNLKGVKYLSTVL